MWPGQRLNSFSCTTRRAAVRAAGGFTFVELLVVIAITAILIAVSVAVAARVKNSSSSAACCANLRQIAYAFHMYARDHQRLPNPPQSGISWENALKNRLAASALRCQADQEIFSAVGSSYDWRDTGNEETTLAGRNIAEARPDAVLAFETLAGWHSAGMINAVRVDGSVQMMEEADRMRDLQRSPMRPAPLEVQTEQEK